MRWPVDTTKYPITQYFNDPRYRDSYKRFGLIGHNGIDIGCPNGTPVCAPHSGKVIERDIDAGGYGNYIKIQNDTEGSVLAHLQEFAVERDQEVAEGDIIGYSNNTGNSTGPHLHFGVYLLPRDRSNGFNGFIDQLPLMNHAITAQPIAQWSDQTKIPAKFLTTVEYPIPDDMELQAIRGRLHDLNRDYSGAMAQAHDLKRQLKEAVDAYNRLLTAPDGQNSADYSVSELITMLLKKILAKLPTSKLE